MLEKIYSFRKHKRFGSGRYEKKIEFFFELLTNCNHHLQKTRKNFEKINHQQMLLLYSIIKKVLKYKSTSMKEA